MERLPSDPNLIPKPEMVEAESGSPEVHPAEMPGQNEPGADAPNVHAEVTDAEQPPKTDENDGRWDHDKAETLAPFVKESGLFQQDSEDVEFYSDEENKKKHMEDATLAERNDVRDAEQKIQQNMQAELVDDSFYTSTHREDQQTLNNAHEKLEQKKALIEEDFVEELQRSRELRAFHAESALSAPEELYDINPDKFKNMPTSEFMEVVKEFSIAKRQVEFFSSIDKELLKMDDEFTWHIEEQKEMNMYRSDKILDELKHTFDYLYEDTNEMYEQRHLADEVMQPTDRFNLSPRQILENQQKFIAELKVRAERLAEDAKAKEQAILDSHKPDESHED